MKAYRDGTPLADIIKDGWAMGFSTDQTYDEAREMGFKVSKMYIEQEWQVRDLEYIDYCNKQRLGA